MKQGLLSMPASPDLILPEVSGGGYGNIIPGEYTGIIPPNSILRISPNGPST